MAHHIHSFDNVLTVGERPWHGLGVNLATPPASGLEALEMSGLNWEATLKPIFLEDGRQVILNDDGALNKGAHHAVVRSDTGTILGVVGPKYVPYQNCQMAALFDPLVQDGTITIETCGSLYNGRKVWMLGKLKGPDLAIDSNDSVARYISLAHGHDGGMAVRFGWTPIRIVCWNTLSASITDERSRLVRALHTKKLSSNLDTLRESMKHADEVFEMTAEQFRLLASRGISRNDLREYARVIVDAPKQGSGKEPSQQQITKMGKIIAATIEGRGNSGRSWWHAYNGVTEYLTWEAGRNVDTRMNSLWFGEGAITSKEALDLALEMSA